MKPVVGRKLREIVSVLKIPKVKEKKCVSENKRI